MEFNAENFPELFVDYCDLSLTVENPDEIALQKFNNLSELNWMSRVKPMNNCKPCMEPCSNFQKYYIPVGGKKVYMLIESLASDYEDYNIISSFFTDTIRSKGKKNADSVYNFFQKNKLEILNNIRRNCRNYQSMNYYQKMHEVRETVYNIFGKRNECTSHRVTVPFSLYHYFNAEKVLDYSAGWGDRAIAAMASGIAYTGIDPNPELHSCYKRMLDLFKPQQKVEFIQCCAEDHSTDEVYDLMYTSPPYYNLERYTDHPDQSIKKYSSYRDWKEKFYFKMLLNSIKHVKHDGFIAVNIINWTNRGCNYRMLDDMINFMMDKNQLFMGFIYYNGGSYKGNAMPIAVFRVVH